MACATTSGADEDRHRTGAEYGARHRRREQITQRMIAMRAEHDQARLPAGDLFEQNVGGPGRGGDRVDAMRHAASSQKVAACASDHPRLDGLTVNREDIERV